MRLVAEPLIPLALWLALALLAIAVSIWYGLTHKMVASRRQTTTILSLMSLTLALPLLVLLNLTWIENVPPPAGKPLVRVLVDTSASMATDDVNGQSRLSHAQAIAENATKMLSKQFEVQVATFDQTLQSSNVESLKNATNDPSQLGQETNLAAAIAGAIKEDNPQGQTILLLSDGIHNASRTSEVLENAAKACAMDVPIFTSSIGGEVGVKNIAVSLRSPQELAFVGQLVPAVVIVESIGFDFRPITVSLWKNGQEMQTREVIPGENHFGEAAFEISETTPGLYRYEVRAAEVLQEATTADNRATLMFRVVDQPIKMLLVEGKPYWDTKFLVRRLAADQSLELTSVIRLAENRYQKRTVARVGRAGEPGEGQSQGTEASTIIQDAEDVLSAESLSDIQILVLGRNAEYFLSDDSLEALRNWISRDGGSLVCARGAPSAQINKRLGQILPVEWATARESRFRVSMTSQGKELRWLASFGDVLGSMPSLATTANASRREGLSNVLAATIDPVTDENNIPVISYQPYGSGRTVVVEGAGMWRWALMSPEFSGQEDVYATLWQSLLRWLVSRAGLQPGQNISLQPDRVTFDTGNVATATMLVRHEKISEVPHVVVKSGDSFSTEFVPRPVGQDPGVYRLDFGKLQPGQYTLETITAAGTIPSVTAAFDVRQRWVETLELNARPDLMNRIAQSSGGSVLQQADPEELAGLFQEHLQKSRPPQFRRVAMWDRWWVMIAILGLWSVTWIMRRRSGLV